MCSTSSFGTSHTYPGIARKGFDWQQTAFVDWQIDCMSKGNTFKLLKNISTTIFNPDEDIVWDANRLIPQLTFNLSIVAEESMPHQLDGAARIQQEKLAAEGDTQNYIIRESTTVPARSWSTQGPTFPPT